MFIKRFKRKEPHTITPLLHCAMRSFYADSQTPASNHSSRVAAREPACVITHFTFQRVTFPKLPHPPPRPWSAFSKLLKWSLNKPSQLKEAQRWHNVAFNAFMSSEREIPLSWCMDSPWRGSRDAGTPGSVGQPCLRSAWCGAFSSSLWETGHRAGFHNGQKVWDRHWKAAGAG